MADVLLMTMKHIISIFLRKLLTIKTINKIKKLKIDKKFMATSFYMYEVVHDV